MADRYVKGNSVYWTPQDQSQLNKKVIQGPNAGEHYFYVPRTGGSGYVGPNVGRPGPNLGSSIRRSGR